MKDKQLTITFTFSLYKLIKNILFILIILFLLKGWYNTYSNKKEFENLYITSQDSLQTIRNEKGEFIAKIQSLQTLNVNTFLQFKIRDSLLKDLQKEVKEFKKYLKKQGNVSVINTEASINETTPTEIITDNISSFPTYKSTFKNKWINYIIEASKDSTKVQFSFRDKYTTKFGLEPTGFLGLGKGKPFSEITSSNPYNEIKTLKTYNVTTYKPNKLGIGINLSYGYNSLLEKNIYLGVGFNYNLIEF